MTNATIPCFNSYATPGDFIEWESEGYTIRATLHEDDFTHVNDSECYSEEQIQAWLDNEWFYVGIILSVSYNRIEIDDLAACKSGVDCNLPGGDNNYLSEWAFEMQDEVIEAAKVKRQEIIKVLTE